MTAKGPTAVGPESLDARRRIRCLIQHPLQRPSEARLPAAGGILSLGEGVGLALRSRWAGLLVVVESGFFIPLEIYSLLREPSLTIVVVLALNVTIFVYLHRNRDRLFRHG